jgi:hypothetical protein
MPNFRRSKGETVSEWAARLRSEDATRLTPRQLDELTLRLVQAAMAARRAGRGTTANSDPVVRCQKAVEELSAEERRRLVRWMQDGLAG